MQLALVGLSHKTAPVEIRERLAFNSDALRCAHVRLSGRREVKEAMILSTCNRVEVVAESPDDRPDPRFPVRISSDSSPTPSRNIFTASGMPTRSVTFSGSTSSLDSMMVGEPQILGQVKEAYRIAADAGTVGMHFERADEPRICGRQEGPQRNRHFAIGCFGQLCGGRTGAKDFRRSVRQDRDDHRRQQDGRTRGKTSQASGRFIGTGDESDIRTRRRTGARYSKARQFHSSTSTDHMDRADIVISSTGAPHFIIGKTLAEQVIHRTKEQADVFHRYRGASRHRSAGQRNRQRFSLRHRRSATGDRCQSERADEGSHARRRDRRSRGRRRSAEKMQSREVVPTIVQLRERRSRSCGATRSNEIAGI